MLKLVKRLIMEDDGQGLVEYALIIALVAVVLAVSLTEMKDKIAQVFTKITNSL